MININEESGLNAFQQYLRGQEMNLTMIYVDTPFWRAEIGRIALHHGNIPFTDKRIKRDEFIAAKQHGKLQDGFTLPFSQIPVLIIDDQPLAQTGAISRFCGKLGNLYPVRNPVKAAKIDQIIDFATDITVLFSIFRKSNGGSQVLKERETFFHNMMYPKLSMLENCLEEDQEWSVGSKMTISDLTIWRLFGWLSSGIIDGFPTDFIKTLPKIQRICLRVDSQNSIREWVAKTYPKAYVRGHYGE